MLSAIDRCAPHVDRGEVRRAFRFAARAHQNMRRYSGEPFIVHPLAVATIVAEMRLDTVSVCSALLHDVVEDTEVDMVTVEREFGTEVARIVNSLTQIERLSGRASIHQQVETYRKILLAMAEDVRVILIKLADRLDNMRTIEHLSPERRWRMASETRYIYAPLARRLGLHRFYTELEDLAFRVLEPEAYEKIVAEMEKLMPALRACERRLLKKLRTILTEQLEVPFSLHARIKSPFSIYQKMQTKGVPLNQIYDLLAVRVVLDSPPEREVEDCYRVLGIIHAHFVHVPERVRDWIAAPRPTGYRALHTTVRVPSVRGSCWAEVQIRSVRMHHIAEEGIAAHWRYKEDGQLDFTEEQLTARIREVVSVAMRDPQEFLSQVRLNLYTDEIYTFTPEGKLIRLPVGATVLDFAFAVHTQLGLHCIGAKVNGRLVKPDYRLHNADIVEVLTSRAQVPMPHWLDVVRTAKARRAIRRWLRSQARELTAAGREKVREFLRAHGVKVVPSVLRQLMRAYGFTSLQSFYMAVGSGEVSLEWQSSWEKTPEGKLVILQERRVPSLEVQLMEALWSATMGVLSTDEPYMLARCCYPLPGDKIVAIRVPGSTPPIQVHKPDCARAQELMARYGYSLVKTKWNSKNEITFLVGLRVEGLDRKGVIYEISKIISKQMDLNMHSISVEERGERFEGVITLYVRDRATLRKVMERLRALDFIVDVQPISPQEAISAVIPLE